MSNEFDPYREALVIETLTIWPDEYDHWEPEEKARVEMLLHSNPKDAAQMEYVRMHTGFRRQITVTAEDLERLQVGQ